MPRWTFFVIAAALAASVEGSDEYAFREMIARNALPMSGVTEGRVLERSGCESAPTANAPIAAVVGSRIGLSVTLMACAGDAGAGRGLCTYDTGADEGEIALGSLAGEGEVAVPETTGVYELRIACDVETKGGSFRVEGTRSLYVTYGAPLIDSPEAVWYERASSWGAGFAAGAPEGQVLKAMLDGIYRFGAEHWRYGSFPGASASKGGDAPSCSGKGDHYWCSCSWKDLVAGNESCNFGSCYEFSDVLEASAMVLGIGGFEPVEIRGSMDAGFATSPDAVSFDTSFPRNIVCTEGEGAAVGCPAYLFSSHSLRRRGGEYFDATFNQTYETAATPVYRSIEYTPSGTIGSSLVLLRHSPGSLVLTAPGTLPTSYGSWDYYEFLPEDANKVTPLVSLHRPGEVPRPRFQNVGFEIVKDRAGRRFLGVVASFDLTTYSDATFDVRGALRKDGRLVSNKPRRHDPRFTGASVRGAGKHSVRLRFSGEDIFHADADGPYELHVEVREAGSREESLAALDWQTPPYDHEEFGAARVDELEISARDRSSSKASFLAREPGLYRYVARLERNGVTLGYARGTLQVEAGLVEVPLSFPDTPSTEPDGLRVSFEILNEDWESEASAESVVGGSSS